LKGDRIYYKAGYKYQLHDTYQIQTKIYPGVDVRCDYISLNRQGVLMIFKGYAWNGCSGPTVDDKTNQRASLVHDSLYQLLENALLPQSCRKQADDLFYDILREDGMWLLRAKYYWFAVRKFGRGAAAPKPEKILIAP
jgi:hypothetical protein